MDNKVNGYSLDSIDSKDLKSMKVKNVDIIEPTKEKDAYLRWNLFSAVWEMELYNEMKRKP